MKKKFNLRKLTISALLSLSLIVSFSSTVLASNENEIDVPTNVVTSTASSTYCSNTGTASEYKYINFSIPSSTYCSILFAGKSLSSDTGVWVILTGPNGQVLNINTPSDGSSYLTHKTLPAGNYTITLYCSGSYWYNANIYEY